MLELGYEIVYVKRGGAQIDVFPHADPIPCSTDDAFITSPGVLHSFRIPQCFEPLSYAEPRLLNEIRGKRHLQLFLIYAKLLELFVMLHRRLLPESRRTTRDALIQAVFDRVRTHYNEDLSVERLAGYVGLSPSYLSRCFASETGTHLSEYIVV